MAATGRGQEAAEGLATHHAHAHSLTARERRSLDGLVGSLPGSVHFRLLMHEGGGRKLVYISPAIERMFELDRTAVESDPRAWYALIHPDDRHAYRAAEEEAFARMSVLRFEPRVRTADGEYRTFDVISSPERQDDGCVVWNAVATDISEQIALRRERQRLLDLIEATPDIVAISRADGAIETLNRAGRAAFGLPEAGPVRAAASDFHPDALRQMYAEEVLPTATRGEAWVGESELLTSSGDVMPVTQVVVAERDGDGETTHYATIMRDRSAEKAAADQAELAFRESNHRLKNFFALVPAIVQLSTRTAASMEDLNRSVQARIAALGRSHALTMTASTTDEGVSLLALTEAVLLPWQQDSPDGAVPAWETSGPELRLSGSVSNALSLTLHELATNAAKHGVFTRGAR